MGPVEHCGIEYKMLSREEALMDSEFPIHFRVKLIDNPNLSYVVLMALEPCEDFQQYIMETIH